MNAELLEILRGWSELDTWIVIASAVVSMSCAVPGVYLLVRRQSMLGDTLSHTALPGITLGFLAAVWLRDQGWLASEHYETGRRVLIVGGAMLMGVFASLLTELVRKLGQVDGNAALGVVFTSLFALGLLLIRRFADEVDLDPDCVLYGAIETAAIDVVGTTGIPRAVWVSGTMLALNLLLTGLLFKELRVAAFDPAFATTQGISAGAIHYGLTAVTAATLVAAFESVGSILVIAMLVGPAATARLLTHGIGRMLAWSLVIAAATAVLGHVSTITIPPFLFRGLGFPGVVDAGTAGMTAVASGALFLLAMIFSPQEGLLTRLVRHLRLVLQVATEDLLGQLYRQEEVNSASDGRPPAASGEPPFSSAWRGGPRERLGLLWLSWRGEVRRRENRWWLTDSGRLRAEQLVRAHRLWETYMAKHFELPEDHLHDTAERVEHFIGPEMRQRIAQELAAPAVDPHGKSIPTE